MLLRDLLRQNSGDYFITDSIITGNTYANLATGARVGFSGMTMSNTHCGWAPFGIYQEAADGAVLTNVFLGRCRARLGALRVHG